MADFLQFLCLRCHVFRFCCCCLVPKSCPTLLQLHGLWPTRLLCPRDFPGKNTGMGSHFLLQGIFLTQGSNPYLLLARGIFFFLTTETSEKSCVQVTLRDMKIYINMNHLFKRIRAILRSIHKNP